MNREIDIAQRLKERDPQWSHEKNFSIKVDSDLVRDVCDARMEIERLREVLGRYRYACQFAAADAWDGGSDIRRRFEWARANDPGSALGENDAAWWGHKYLKSEGATKLPSGVKHSSA